MSEKKLIKGDLTEDSVKVILDHQDYSQSSDHLNTQINNAYRVLRALGLNQVVEYFCELERDL